MRFRTMTLMLSFFALTAVCECRASVANGGAGDAQNNKEYAAETWMSDLKHTIGDVSICDLKIPGTHDSGTYPFTENSDAASDRAGVKFAAEAIPNSRKLLVAWSRTQDKPIYEQLQAGARYLDLRLTVERDGFYLCHGLKGRKLDDELQWIDQFLRAHPGEFVILKIKAFDDKVDEKHAGQNITQRLVRCISDHFDKKMLERMEAVNTVTLNYMNRHKKQVIVIYDTKKNKPGSAAKNAVESYPFLFDERSIQSVWQNKRGVKELHDSLVAESKTADRNKMYVIHYTLTANAPYIASHLTGTGDEQGIAYMTSKLDEDHKEKSMFGNGEHYSLSRLLQDVERINIVVFDFINADKCKKIINLNLNR